MSDDAQLPTPTIARRILLMIVRSFLGSAAARVAGASSPLVVAVCERSAAIRSSSQAMSCSVAAARVASATACTCRSAPGGSQRVLDGGQRSSRYARRRSSSRIRVSGVRYLKNARRTRNPLSSVGVVAGVLQELEEQRLALLGDRYTFLRRRRPPPWGTPARRRPRARGAGASGRASRRRPARSRPACRSSASRAGSRASTAPSASPGSRVRASMVPFYSVPI